VGPFSASQREIVGVEAVELKTRFSFAPSIFGFSMLEMFGPENTPRVFRKLSEAENGGRTPV
jgi:hypothetical protein